MTAPTLRFRRETLDGGWAVINVLKDGAVIGRIVQHPKTGRYRYFKGAENHLAYSLEQADLAALEQAIEHELAGLDQPGVGPARRIRPKRPPIV